MKLSNTYLTLVTTKPYLVLGSIVFLSVIAIYFSLRFELDASGESLVLENDTSLNYYRQIREQYGTDEFLVITYTPNTDLLSENSLEGLRSLRDKFLEMDSVASVTSILDVPLIYTTDIKLSELGEDLQILDDGNIDKQRVRDEFATNPLYRDLLVSEDGKTTAIQITFKFDETQYELYNQRQALNDLAAAGELTPSEIADLEDINDAIIEHNSRMLDTRAEEIQMIREIMDGERNRADMFLGGLPMIVTDMISYIRSDLYIFGTGVLVFLVFILTLFFRHVRWVILPLLCCSITAILMFGFLGLAGWRVTVISSNFMSILLIITLSLTVHLIVRYRDLQLENPQDDNLILTRQTMLSMAKPCFYTILTTVVAFASLVVSNIRPVIDFGWIMIIGLSAAFVISFLIFPALLSLMPPARHPPDRDLTRNFTLWISRLVRTMPVKVLLTGIAISLLVGTGMSYLKVENRFIDNFKPTTEIYQGMIVIDQKLGGTTPLEIILDSDEQYLEDLAALDSEDEDLEDFFSDFEEQESPPSYWLTPSMMNKVKQLQAHMENISSLGKVISIATALQIAEKLNGGDLDAFDMAIMHKRVPDAVKEELITPYLSEDTNQLRISARAIESDRTLNRQQLLENLESYLIDDLQLKPEQVNITGMLVLYNNMLQSLFRSQIMTLGAVLLAIFITFVILFQNFTLAVLGIIPNIFSAVMILGIMGWLRIPLDMMTITIASITIGIAVDDTIHYIHRFKKEYSLNPNLDTLINRCHGSIGKAMFYTSVAIVFGFGILGLSNFIPTINFGMMTGIAMLVALAGNLVLLPALILLVKPKV